MAIIGSTISRTINIVDTININNCRNVTLVSEQQRVHGGGEEDGGQEVHRPGREDRHDRADGDRLLGVRQVARPVGARHDARHGGEEDADDEGEGGPDVHDDVAVGLLAAEVVLRLLGAVGHHVAALVVGVPHRLGEGPARDALDAAALGHVVVAEVLVALEVVLSRHVAVEVVLGVLQQLGHVVQLLAECVPELGAVHGVLDTVGDLGDEPGAHHADVGLVVPVPVVRDPGEHADDGAEHADQRQARELVDDLDAEEDDGPHDEEED